MNENEYVYMNIEGITKGKPLVFTGKRFKFKKEVKKRFPKATFIWKWNWFLKLFLKFHPNHILVRMRNTLEGSDREILYEEDWEEETKFLRIALTGY